MELDRLIEGLELLVPIAKTIPVFGTIIEGSLEATVKLVKYAQVRHMNCARCSATSSPFSGREDEQRRGKGAR
jgi:hypothetical protein